MSDPMMCRPLPTLFALLAGLVASCPAVGAVIYVRANAAPGGNGTSWSNAYSSLDTALAAATGPNKEIWVAQGTYVPSVPLAASAYSKSFVLPAGVTMLGGFGGWEGSATERDPEGHPTILSGDALGNDGPAATSLNDNVTNVVRVSGAGVRTVDGFVIQGGKAPQTGYAGVFGSGVSVTGGSFFLRHCVLRRNSATQGGGMAVSGGAFAFVENSEVLECSASVSGGGLRVEGATLTVVGTRLEDNRALGADGAAPAILAAEGSTLIAAGCDVHRNIGTNVGGIYLSKATALFSECGFEENRKGALAIYASTCDLIGCEFFQNSQAPQVYCLTTSGTPKTTTVQSCIFAHGSQDGLSSKSTPVVVKSSVFVNNFGAAIRGTYSASLTAKDCTFEGNGIFDSLAGAVVGENSIVDLSDSLIRANAGGVYVQNTDKPATIRGCTFEYCRSGPAAGALRSQASLTTVDSCVFRFCTGGLFPAAFILGNGRVVECEFDRNSGSQAGAMLLATGGAGTSSIVANCRFVGNRSTAATMNPAGAIMVASGAPHRLQNCFFSGNASVTSGGAIRLNAGAILHLDQCTVVGNASAGQSGGVGSGVFVNGVTVGTLSVNNSIIWGNGDGTQGNQIGGTTSALTIGGSCVQGWTGSLGGQNNDGADPRFVGFAGPDALVGTPDDSPVLQAGSPSIGAGLLSLLAMDLADLDRDGVTAEPLPIDLFGLPRVQANLDRGAVESLK
jgi:hypothetical protein